MSINSLQASNAYNEALQNLQGATSNTPSSNLSPNIAEGTFSELLSDALSQTNANIQSAEKAGSAVVTGDASLVDVVTSISAAEISLEAAIAVRNRMIEAYQEIMRMPI